MKSLSPLYAREVALLGSAAQFRVRQQRVYALASERHCEERELVPERISAWHDCCSEIAEATVT